MSAEKDITGHYTSGKLMERLRQALLSDGADPDHPTLEALAPYDQFHGRGIAATRELAEALDLSASDHVLDIGSGIGGPARYMADRAGCRVTGIDLTEEFCVVARQLTALTGLEDRVGFELGNALEMPFPHDTFDAAYSMNVSMNIADKSKFYGEILRVLKPTGHLVLSEIAQGPGGEIDYPAPWAKTAQSSFLATPEDTLAGLEAAGFEIVARRDTADEAMAFGALSRQIVADGGKPPHRAVQLIHGELAKAAMGNMSHAIAQNKVIPIEVVCRKP